MFWACADNGAGNTGMF